LVMFKEREGRFRSLKDSHAVGAELERLVLGGVPSQRSARRSQQVVTADGETGAQPAAARTVTADELLTHAPRPRKKKRRVD
jgi:hypothetical protein